MDRRDFLKTSAALSIAIGVPIDVVFDGERNPSEIRRLGTGKYGNSISVSDWPPAIEILRILKNDAVRTVGDRPIKFIWRPPSESEIRDPFMIYGSIAWVTV